MESLLKLVFSTSHGITGLVTEPYKGAKKKAKKKGAKGAAVGVGKGN